jgi:hypothetical protein
MCILTAGCSCCRNSFYTNCRSRGEKHVRASLLRQGQAHRFKYSSEIFCAFPTEQVPATLL